MGQSELGQDGVSIDVRHVQVEEDEVLRVVAHPRDDLPRICDRVQVAEARVEQDSADQDSIGLVVVHHEHTAAGEWEQYVGNHVQTISGLASTSTWSTTARSSSTSIGLVR